MGLLDGLLASCGLRRERRRRFRVPIPAGYPQALDSQATTSPNTAASDPIDSDADANVGLDGEYVASPAGSPAGSRPGTPRPPNFGKGRARRGRFFVPPTSPSSASSESEESASDEEWEDPVLHTSDQPHGDIRFTAGWTFIRGAGPSFPPPRRHCQRETQRETHRAGESSSSAGSSHNRNQNQNRHSHRHPHRHPHINTTTNRDRNSNSPSSIPDTAPDGYIHFEPDMPRVRFQYPEYPPRTPEITLAALPNLYLRRDEASAEAYAGARPFHLAPNGQGVYPGGVYTQMHQPGLGQPFLRGVPVQAAQGVNASSSPSLYSPPLLRSLLKVTLHPGAQGGLAPSFTVPVTIPVQVGAGPSAAPQPDILPSGLYAHHHLVPGGGGVVPPFTPYQGGCSTGGIPPYVNGPFGVGMPGGPGYGCGNYGTMRHGHFEAEDFQPSDEDPNRMYYCRELDGSWTLRSRFAINKSRKDIRWYITPEGMFYAIRIRN
ncbi:hypothetical protein SAPIO_CDS5667 [Scedosporium apiospermum]|uniref:Uncharacterized protein n=1 Tax=Pseudallescheria apiosperma TaxID=563466 RepID=A0A084G549_PSEDA|nr:uncharacterized protein SAPIO_CDS5667 [Scedosporium apiospermum]KEZ42461.1 hypothetical protein SAPIO_CDS5667 [Scedosporium apiospermum]